MTENLSSWFVNNKGADQPAQPHSLICIFVVPSLESKTKPATCQVSLYDWARWFEPNLVTNPENRVSCDFAKISNDQT